MAVLETTTEDILSEGLGFDRCDVAVVTGIEHAELLPAARALVRVVNRTGTAVLHADVPLAEDCPGSVILFSASSGAARISQHRSAGGRVVFIRDGFVVLADGASEVRCIQFNSSHASGEAENVMPIVAAYWALGLPLDVLSANMSEPLLKAN
jgi:cyanophycin synthetase